MTRESAVADPHSMPGAATSRAGEGRRTESSNDLDHCEALWSMCVAIAQRRRQGLPAQAFSSDASGRVRMAQAVDASGSLDAIAAAAAEGESEAAALRRREPRTRRTTAEPDKEVLRVARRAGEGWQLAGDWSAQAREMFDLYRPLLDLAPGERYLLGHLGQSIDGRIATSSGDSCFINGQQNLIHMHRLRALCDAVLVGAGTVVADDPQLTTRLVPGPHATRVVLDPSMRLTPDYRICGDGKCPTLIARLAPAIETACGRAEIIPAAACAAGIDLPGLLDCLAERGLHVILVEGGGITVSRFLAQGLLNRLQIAIAPVIIGSGRQGLQLPEVLALGDCLRPSCRHHRMGPDILWDLDLRAPTG